MLWNVFLYKENGGKSRPRKYNIFHNRSFSKGIEDLFSEPELPFDHFEARVRELVRWQFWDRSEYECIINPWPRSTQQHGYALDVGEQLEINWERFIEYLWDCYCFGEEHDYSDRCNMNDEDCKWCANCVCFVFPIGCMKGEANGYEED